MIRSAVCITAAMFCGPGSRHRSRVPFYCSSPRHSWERSTTLQTGATLPSASLMRGSCTVRFRSPRCRAAPHRRHPRRSLRGHRHRQGQRREEPAERTRVVRGTTGSAVVRVMPQSTRLARICSVFADGDWIESKDQSQWGIRLVQTGNVGEGKFKERAEKARFISESTFKRLHCTEIFADDCLVSQTARPCGSSLPTSRHG